MDPQTQALHVYRELADRFDERNDANLRDRFLMLAADAALAAGLPDEAEWLRHRLLQSSRHHMLRGYPSFMVAANAADVQTYLRDLRQNYPLETATRMLNGLRSGELVPGLGESIELDSDAPAKAGPRAPESVPPTAHEIDLRGMPPLLSGRDRVPSGLEEEPFYQIDSSEATPRPPAANTSRQNQAAATPPRPHAGQPTPGWGSPSAGPLPIPSPKPLAQPRPTGPVDPPLGRPAPAHAPAPPTALPPTRPEFLEPFPEYPHADHPEGPTSRTTTGAWFSATLGVLTVLIGLAWAGVTLARPFLPPDLFR